MKKEKVKNFIKTYWIPILLLLACVVLMGGLGSKYFRYRHELRIVDKVLKTVQKEKAVVKRELRNLTVEYNELNSELDIHKKLLISEQQKRKKDSIRYETKIIDLRAAPTNALYLYFTKELDGLSFE